MLGLLYSRSARLDLSSLRLRQSSLHRNTVPRPSTGPRASWIYHILCSFSLYYLPTHQNSTQKITTHELRRLSVILEMKYPIISILCVLLLRIYNIIPYSSFSSSTHMNSEYGGSQRAPEFLHLQRQNCYHPNHLFTNSDIGKRRYRGSQCDWALARFTSHAREYTKLYYSHRSRV
ncbi:hypothetical protein F4801DRAFT_565060, partial [Xylaria longipes]